MKTILCSLTIVFVAVLLSGCGAMVLATTVGTTTAEVAIPAVAVPAISSAGDVAVGLAVAAASSQVVSSDGTEYTGELAGEQQIWYDMAHAVERHGIAAFDAVQDCLSTKGVMLYMRNYSNGRIAKICQLDDGRFGVEVDESTGDLVTTFIKEKLKVLDKVIRYLTNAGYTK